MKQKKLYSKPEVDIVRLESAMVLGQTSFNMSDATTDDTW